MVLPANQDLHRAYKEIIGCVSWKHPIQQRTHTPRCSLWSFLMSKGHVCRAGWKVGNLLCSQRCPSSQNSSWPRVWGWPRLTLSNVGAAVWRRLWVQGGGQRSDMGGDHPNLQGWRSANPRCWQPQGGRFSSNPRISKWRYTPNYEDAQASGMELHKTQGKICLTPKLGIPTRKGISQPCRWTSPKPKDGDSQSS